MKTSEETDFEASDGWVADRNLRAVASRIGLPALPGGIERQVLGRVRGRRRRRQCLAAGFALLVIWVSLYQGQDRPPIKGPDWVQADLPTLLDSGEGLNQSVFTAEDSHLLSALPPVVALDLIEQDMVAMLNVISVLEGARP
jgi:hypothetical protein